MKPYEHAVSSAKKFGGKPEEYQKFHDWFDQTKAAHPDMRHRAILHNSMGCFILEQVFGPSMTNSDGKVIPTRSIAEQHVLEDLGFIPTVSDYLDTMEVAPWMAGVGTKIIIDGNGKRYQLRPTKKGMKAVPLVD